MNSVDDRVVQLSFNNKEFERNAATSLSTLDKLKNSLNFSDANKSMASLQNTARGFNLAPLATSIEGVSGKFVALGTIGITTLANLTNSALEAGKSIVGALTVSPIGAGFNEYELKMGAIQTIMAGSGKSLSTVSKYLQELNAYSDKTIYSFADMTQNIGKFTNAGVGLKKAVGAIQGIANVAAISGANANEASRAMYNFSQALSKGSVALIDWKSIEFANMATKGFKTELLNTAVAMGELTKKGDKYVTQKGTLITATKGFNDSLNQEWLTSKVLTKTLGDYADEQTAIGKKAFAAAKDVKTLSQMFDTLKEAAGSGWSESFEIIFGNLDEAKGRWTELNGVIGGWIQSSADSRNEMLRAWKAAGGQQAAIDALKNAWSALGNIITPIRKAWQEVFPPTSAKSLADITKSIRDFFGNLKMGPQQMESVRVAFKGLFTILSIGKQIISGVFGFFKDMFGLISSSGSTAAGGLLKFAEGIGATIIRFDQFLKQSNAIPAFFDRLSNAVGPIVVKIKDLVSALGGIVGGALSKIPTFFSSMGSSASSANDGISPLESTVSNLETAWTNFVNTLKGTLPFLANIGETIKSSFSGGGEGVSGFMNAISEKLAAIDWPLIFKGVTAVGLVAMMGAVVKSIYGAIKMIMTPFKFLDNIGNGFASALEGIGGALEGYGKKLKGEGLKQAAIAILLLAVGLKILSTIPVDDLAASALAMVAVTKSLSLAMDSLSSNPKILSGAAAMILMATAIDILAIAVFAFGKMDTNVLAQGGAAVAAALAAITLAVNLMPDGVKLASAGAGILLMSNAILVLSLAVLAFGNMDQETLTKGGQAVAVALGAMVLAINLMPDEKKMLGAGAGILLMAFAINALIVPIKLLGMMDIEELKQGLSAVALALLGMVVAANLMAAPGVMTGALAMVVVAASLLVLATAIKVLAGLTWEQVTNGILALVGTMVLIAGVAVILQVAIPYIYAFGVALSLLGAGFALLGLGMLLGAAAFQIVLGLMALGVPVLIDAINNFIEIIPVLGRAFQLMLEAVANAFAEATPEIVNAIVVLILALLDAAQRLVPELQDTFETLVQAGLDTIAFMVPAFVTTGLKLINGLLKGIGDNLPDIITNGKKVIIAWIKGMGKASLEIATAAGDALLDFLEGITTWIRANEERINTTTKEFAKAIIDGIAAGVRGLASGAFDALGEVATGMLDRAKEALGINSPSKEFMKVGASINEGLVLGIVGTKQHVLDVINSLMENIKQARESVKQDIKDLKQDLKSLKDADPKSAAEKKKNAKQIAKTKAQLKEAEDEQRRLEKAWKTISKERKVQEAQLAALGDQYEKIKTKLEDAQQAYADAVRERDDYNKKITEQYSALPTLDENTTLDNYFDQIRKNTAANIKFKATLEQLRKLGLDDTSYRKFLEKGVDAQPFLDSLLLAGGDAINELANIDRSLAESAADLGKSGSKELYQAGVDMAKGIMEGFQSDMDSIIKQMKTLGKAIADELKKELGIKSPSKVFKEIGKFTVQGFADGLDKNADIIDLSAKRLSKSAVDSLKSSMEGLTNVVGADLNVEPVIAPVLDLDKFRKDAAGIGDILTPGGISPEVSAGAANDISAKMAQRIKDLQTQELQATGTTVELTQNNYSPKALSAAELYRQTHNQLSVAKGALNR